MNPKLPLTIFIAVLILNSCSKSSPSSSNNNPSGPTIVAPTIGATTAITGINPTTASSGGNISSDGGASITARGICWSTSVNPTTVNSKTTDGTGTGSFTSSLSGLTASTVYYVRAYATNSVGTSYGPEISFTTAPAIGSSYQGGKLAYILQPSDPGYDPNVIHGLIVAANDQTNVIGWDNGIAHITGATGTAIGTGNANTNLIIATEGAGNYAARVCYDLVLNGYSDWYLPSKDELYKIYLNQAAIGPFFPYFYWSSSEDPLSVTQVWALRFDGSNVPVLIGKGFAFITRAVRSF